MASGTIKSVASEGMTLSTQQFTATYNLDAATISSSSITPKSANPTFDVTRSGWTPVGVVGFDTGGGIHPCAKVVLDGTTVSMVVTNFKDQAYSNRTATINVLYYKTE